MTKDIHELFSKQKLNTAKRFKDYQWRKRNLKILLNEIMNSQKEICEAVYRDFKKPEQEVKLTEIFHVTTDIKHTLRKLKSWMKPRRFPAPTTFFGSTNKIIYEPIGHSLIISPWNFLFMLAVGPLVSAIAADNSVILKPSEIS